MIKKIFIILAGISIVVVILYSTLIDWDIVVNNIKSNWNWKHFEPLSCVNHESEQYISINKKVEDIKKAGSINIVSGALYEKVDITIDSRLGDSFTIDLNNPSGEYVCKLLYYVYYFDDIYGSYESNKDTLTESELQTIRGQCCAALDELYSLKDMCIPLQEYFRSIPSFSQCIYISANDYFKNNLLTDPLREFLHQNDVILDLLLMNDHSKNSKVRKFAEEAEKQLNILKLSVMKNEINTVEGLNRIDQIWEQFKYNANSVRSKT